MTYITPRMAATTTPRPDHNSCRVITLLRRASVGVSLAFFHHLRRTGSFLFFRADRVSASENTLLSVEIGGLLAKDMLVERQIFKIISIRRNLGGQSNLVQFYEWQRK